MFIVYIVINDIAIDEAKKRIDGLLLYNKALHSYVEEVQKPIIYQLKEEGKLYQEFFTPEVLSFTYIARNMHNYHKKRLIDAGFDDYSYKLASTNPRNPINKADPLERRLLEKFNTTNEKSYEEKLVENGKTYLYRALAIAPNKQSCMRCHGDPKDAPREMLAQYGEINGFGEKVGDIRAIISMKVPIESQLVSTNKTFALIAVIIFIVFSVILWVIKLLFETQKRYEDLKERRSCELLQEQSKYADLGNMIGVIVHQWKQPLNAIGLYTQDLGDAYDNNEIDRNYLDKHSKNVLKQINYMSDTIEQFRNYLIPDKKLKKFNVKKSIEGIIKILKPILKRSNITVNTELESFKIEGIEGEFSHVMLNLINNAIFELQKKNIPNATITITAQQSGVSHIISVEDNAGGIDETLINQIFNLYFTTKGGEGTGIGLYLVKKVVEETLNGSISVQNSDKGAKFIINC
jgi:signal transduction histidine kinase